MVTARKLRDKCSEVGGCRDLMIGEAGHCRAGCLDGCDALDAYTKVKRMLDIRRKRFVLCVNGRGMTNPSSR